MTTELQAIMDNLTARLENYSKRGGNTVIIMDSGDVIGTATQTR
jgi:hypothetical protein